MLALRWTAYAAFALAALAGMGFVNDADIFMLSAGLSLALSGMLLLAIDRGLTLLCDIRDRLPHATHTPYDTSTPETETPQPRPIAELEADLQRLKSAR